MATFNRFEEIVAWQKARELNRKLGEYIDGGRFQRNFPLINQMEAAAGSVMDNIAEGHEHSGNREFLQFLYIAKGSCGELGSQLYRALDRRYIEQPEFDELHTMTMAVMAMLQKLINYLQSSEIKGPKYRSTPKQNIGNQSTTDASLQHPQTPPMPNTNS